MLDLLVIGSGYWGQAVALLAERRGLKVSVVDDQAPDGASRAASGHFAFSWYKGEWRSRVEQSVDRARSFGVELTKTGAYRNEKVIADWYTFDPWKVLALRPADVQASVSLIAGAPRAWCASNGRRWAQPARNIVIAAGVYTDAILVESGFAPIGVQSLPGTGFSWAAPPLLGGVKLIPINPFRAYNVRTWAGGTIRLGDTLEKVPGNRHSYVNKMAQAARAAGFEIARTAETHYGRRPMLSDGPRVKLVKPGIVAATGGGRTGGMLSFWAASEALKLLGLS
jgi:glycine/D-amino acid oxidase-like deaminating enzyme